MARWIEFEAIKRTVPLAAVLDHYRIGELRRSGKNHLRGRCPLHGGEGRETFHADTAEQVFHCFSCGAGGSVLDLVAALERCDLRQAAEKLSGWQGSLARSDRTWQPTVTKKIESLPALSFRLRGVDLRHPYLSGRGISEMTAVEFGVGFYRGPGVMSQRLIIPIDDETGRLVGYCGRSLDGSEPRYKFPMGFAKSKVLFNLHRAASAARSEVIVVEGFFDCLKVFQAGFRSVVALMGSALSERQRLLLVEHFHTIILMLDGDQAGRQASIAVSAKLAPDCAVRTIHLSDDIQPDQLSSKSLQELLGQKGCRRHIH
jgi:DNA primase